MAKIIDSGNDIGNNSNTETQSGSIIEPGSSTEPSNPVGTPTVIFHPTNEAGLIRGTERNISYDQNIALSVKQIITQYNSLQNSGTTITIKDVSSIKQLIESSSANNIDKQKIALIKKMQKLQAKCNHSYSQSNNRCIYCTKHKDSHIFDTSKTIL